LRDSVIGGLRKRKSIFVGNKIKYEIGGGLEVDGGRAVELNRGKCTIVSDSFFADANFDIIIMHFTHLLFNKENQFFSIHLIESLAECSGQQNKGHL
jgi:hypothetical protein